MWGLRGSRRAPTLLPGGWGPSSALLAHPRPHGALPVNDRFCYTWRALHDTRDAPLHIPCPKLRAEPRIRSRIPYGLGMTLLGYARVSTDLQDPSLQIDALEEAGAEHIWTERVSGRRDDRPELAELLTYARSGDVLVVWRLDRLGRSVEHLVRLLAELEERGIEFRSLTEALDTTTPGGRLVFHVFAAVAEFTADLTRARTRAGLEAARRRGRRGGRPTVMTPARAAAADELLARPTAQVADVARALGVSRATIYRYLQRERHAVSQ